MVSREAAIQGAIAYMRGIGESGDIRVHVLDEQSQEMVDAMLAHHKQMYEQAAADCKAAKAEYEAGVAETAKSLQTCKEMQAQHDKRMKDLAYIERVYARQDRDQYQMSLFAVLRHLVNVLQVKLSLDKYKPHESIVVLKARLIEIMKNEVDLVDNLTKTRPGFADFVNMGKLQPFLDAIIDEPTMLAPEPHCSARMLSRDLVHYICAEPDKAPFRFCEPLMAKYAFTLLLVTVGIHEATNVLRWLAKDHLSESYISSTMLAGLEKLHEFDPDAGIKDQSKRHSCLDDREDEIGGYMYIAGDSEDGEDGEDDDNDGEDGKDDKTEGPGETESVSGQVDEAADEGVGKDEEAKAKNTA